MFCYNLLSIQSEKPELLWVFGHPSVRRFYAEHYLVLTVYFESVPGRTVLEANESLIIIQQSHEEPLRVGRLYFIDVVGCEVQCTTLCAKPEILL